MADGTQGRRRFQRSQRFPNSLLHHLFNEEFVAKAGLEFRWMHVYIDGIARQVEKQEQRRPVAWRNRRAIAGFRRAQNERVTNRTTAHEHVALTSGGPRLRGPLREARHLERSGTMGDREQGVGQLAAP